MASTSLCQWDPDTLFKIYLRDYLMKKGMHTTAEIFQKEANVRNEPIVIDSPDGFLHEWWTIFYDMYNSMQVNHQETEPESSFKAPNNARKNTLPLIPQMSMRDQRTPQLQISSNFDKTMGPPPACLLPPVLYDKEHLRYLATKDADPSFHLVNEDQLKFLAGTSSNHPLQDIGKQTQKLVFRDSGIGIRLGSDVTGDPMDVVQRTMKPLDGPHETRAIEGLDLVPLNGRPLNNQVLTSLLEAPNYQQQCQVLSTQNQQALYAQVLACTSKNQTSVFPGNTSKCNGQDLKIPRPELSNKDRQIMDQMTRTIERQNQQDQLQKVQFQEVEKRKKRKTTVSSRAGESALDCLNNAADGKPTDENVEAFLSGEIEDEDHRSLPFSNLKRISGTYNTNKSKGFSFGQIGCLHSSKNKVLSCHFSSDGKLVASAGHEKKVFIWNVETFDSVATSEAHSLLVTDVRFRPGSAIFATSSFDRTVMIWDAAKPTKSLFKLTGHAEQVMSLDFHPRKVDLLCSCDSNDIIRLWNVNECNCLHIFKGGSKQVRFQPRFGKLLATATGNDINVIDIDSGSVLNCLKGHEKEVLSICWDRSGNYIASVSEDCARVWSAVSDAKCIDELHSNGNKFQSCIFHPGYTNLLIVGGYESLELWAPSESGQTMTIPAHKGLITGLAGSNRTELIASASHDNCVKLWK